MDKFMLIKENLKRHGQEHILRFWEELNEDEQNKLINQILLTDFDLLKELYINRDNIEQEEGKIEPIPYMSKKDIRDDKRYMQLGQFTIQAGKYAIVIMAGGQGTRLGHNGPKGTYVLDLNTPKSLFEILVDKLKQAKKDYGVEIPFYIMTSEENNDETVKFFEENNYFGYSKSNINFFKQSQLTMLDINGKAILEEKGIIKQAADGNGGIFEAMFKNDVYEDLVSKGIEWVFVGYVDNVLLQIADALMLGLAIDEEASVVSKSLLKTSPYEKVGVFYKKDGKPSVIEYTEVTDEMANEIDENGNFAYGQSYIGCNLFNINAIKQIGDEKLSYHTAIKKCNYIDENGEETIANFPNAYKFETFIFDAFQRLDDLIVLEVNREEEFAPVKNATGVDSPETAIELYNNYNK